MYVFDIPSQQFCHTDAPIGEPNPAAYMARLVDLHAAYLRNKTLEGTSPFEAASWPLKVGQAMGYSGDSNAVPLLAAEAQIRGISTGEIVQRVLDNATTLGGLEAVLSGVAGKHRDAIKALPNDQDVFEYDWRTGWPF